MIEENRLYNLKEIEKQGLIGYKRSKILGLIKEGKIVAIKLHNDGKRSKIMVSGKEIINFLSRCIYNESSSIQEDKRTPKLFQEIEIGTIDNNGGGDSTLQEIENHLNISNMVDNTDNNIVDSMESIMRKFGK